jgi:hypothetical protein
LKTKLRRPKKFHVSWFHVSNISNMHKILKSSTWKEHEDASTANLHRFLGVVSDSTTEGHPIGWCQSRGITSGDQHELGSPVEMSLLCKKLGLPSKACYQVWVLGLQIMNKYVQYLWWYSLTWRMNQIEQELRISASTSQVTHLSTWFSRAPALLHWSHSKRNPHKTS